MPKKKVKKSERLPKYGTPERQMMISVLVKLPAYKDSIEKGSPFFTEEELENIKNRYKEGLTWNDIERELVTKKILLRKLTFRKYIQDKYLPRAIDHRNTNTGRVAVFPADTISHINFIQYFYKVATGEIVDNLLNLLNDMGMTYKEAVESQLGVGSYSNIHSAINHYLTDGDVEAHDAISKGLARRPKDQRKALVMLEKIGETYDSVISKKIARLISFLEENQITYIEIQADEPTTTSEIDIETKK